MVRKGAKGGKNRRRGGNDDFDKREVLFKEAGQEYAQVLKMLGNGRVMALCVDGVNRLCHIRGKMRKKVWINAGDVVLVSLRDYQDEKGDIIHKYTPDDVRTLRAEGDFPEAFRLQEFGNAAEGAGPEDEDIFFGSDDEVIDLEQI